MNPVQAHFRRNSDKFYIAAKLRSDPLYSAVLAELEGSSLPLLDLGCGLGLLAFYLREHGLQVPIQSLDYDGRKITEAKRLARERGLEGLTFAAHDAREGLPDHSGNVTILDILQFFNPEELKQLLTLAAERVAPGGKLIIRSCLKSNSWRFKTTVAGDWLARITFWMKAMPTHYPSEEEFRSALEPFGPVSIDPLWGSTPFNNHLIVLAKA